MSNVDERTGESVEREIDEGAEATSSDDVQGRPLTEEERQRRRRREDAGRELDRSPMNGAGGYVDDVGDHEDPDADQQVGGSFDDARTTFYGYDSSCDDILRSDGSRVSYGDLWAHHHNKNSCSNSSSEWNQNNRTNRQRQFIQTVASKLELTDPQEDHAIRLFEAIDMEETGSLTEEHFGLAAIHVALEIEEERMLMWSSDPLHEEFEEIMGTLDLLDGGGTSSEFKKARRYAHEARSEM